MAWLKKVDGRVFYRYSTVIQCFLAGQLCSKPSVCVDSLVCVVGSGHIFILAKSVAYNARSAR